MQTFMFQSEKDGEFIGFTDRKDGSNLPLDLGPWKPMGFQAIQTGDHVANVQGGGNAVLDGIRRDGFLVVSASTRVQH